MGAFEISGQAAMLAPVREKAGTVRVGAYSVILFNTGYSLLSPFPKGMAYIISDAVS